MRVIDTVEQYNSFRHLMKVMHRLEFKTVNALDSNVLDILGDEFEVCPDCLETMVNCQCNYIDHYDRYGTTSSPSNPYDDYDPG
jgi:hypothetical protein